MTGRDLPSDHQYQVMEAVAARGDGTVRRFLDTSISTLRAMQTRQWVTLHTAMVQRGDQYIEHVVSAGFTRAGLSAYTRAAQHRAHQASENEAAARIANGAPACGAVTNLDPFDALPAERDLPF
jgi:hypothetical protein